MRFQPAFGFVNLDYTFTSGSGRYVLGNAYIPTAPTGFILRVVALNADSFLRRFAINYLAVS
jgi:hypothetical protein